MPVFKEQVLFVAFLTINYLMQISGRANKLRMQDFPQVPVGLLERKSTICNGGWLCLLLTKESMVVREGGCFVVLTARYVALGNRKRTTHK